MILFHLLRELPAELKTLLFVFGAGTVQDLKAGFARLEPHFLEFPVDFLHGAAAPSEASEGAHDPVLRSEPPQVREKLSDGRKHDVIERRRPDEHGAGFPEPLDRDAHRSGPQLDHFDIDSGRFDPFHERRRHIFRAVPHGVVNDHDAEIGLAVRHVKIHLDDLARVPSPDNAVVRGDHVYLDAELLYLGELRLDERAEGHEDVRVIVPHRVFQLHGRALIAILVVEPRGRGKVLAEGVLADKELVLLHVAHHGIGPVEHRGFEERYRLRSRIERIAGFHEPELPPGGVEKAVKTFLAPFGYVDQRVRGEGHDPVEARRMVIFDVVDHHVLDRRGVHKTADIVDGMLREIVLHRVHKRHVLIADEIVIIRRAVRRDIAVKIADRPVNGPYPVNARLDFYRSHSDLLWFTSDADQ